jgi:hypothetical protein
MLMVAPRHSTATSRSCPTVINATGSADSPVHGGLHITHAGCDSISGDAIAMFAEFATSVAQYLSFGGSGTWTATATTNAG